MDSLIVFDMDGVLAEVTESYRESIVQTVRYFTGKTVTRDAIQDYKNQGGWNNDWALSQKIAADFGMQIDYDTVIEKFNEFFLGEDGNGLVTRESWFPQPGLLERLGKTYELALFSGRLRYEADITLRRFAPDVKFAPAIFADDVAAAKPAPDGLLEIRRQKPGHKLWYVGDTVDDARCARAAGVPFIGIAAHTHTKRAELIRLFQQENAVAILENVNEIEGAL
ncbi:MAG TPA: HAD-IA family hydrolase [Bryobacteraceae bacterium]|nr:HAD-IA family hydrolase [Bryobacteraceae bacterium]